MKLESLKHRASKKALIAVSIVGMFAGVCAIPAGAVAAKTIASKGLVYIIPKDTTTRTK